MLILLDLLLTDLTDFVDSLVAEVFLRRQGLLLSKLSAAGWCVDIGGLDDLALVGKDSDKGLFAIRRQVKFTMLPRE